MADFELPDWLRSEITEMDAESEAERLKNVADRARAAEVEAKEAEDRKVDNRMREIAQTEGDRLGAETLSILRRGHIKPDAKFMVQFVGWSRFSGIYPKGQPLSLSDAWAIVPPRQEDMGWEWPSIHFPGLWLDIEGRFRLGDPPVHLQDVAREAAAGAINDLYPLAKWTNIEQPKPGSEEADKIKSYQPRVELRNYRLGYQQSDEHSMNCEHCHPGAPLSIIGKDASTDPHKQLLTSVVSRWLRSLGAV